MFRAVRTLAKEPGFTSAAVATLALGIACSATMFSVLDAVLLAPVPHADSVRVVALETRWKNTGRITPRVSGGDWPDLASAHNLFETAARYYGGEVGVQLRDRAEWAGAYWVSPGFFAVFDAAPVRGRTLAAGDEGRAVEIGAGFARRAFGGDAAAIGQVLRIDTHAYEVAGVMPADFAVPAKAEIWAADPEQPANRSRTAFNYYAVARLAPGIAPEAAGVGLEALGAQLAGQYAENRNKSFAAIPLREMLARGAGRVREYAIRTALGAGGARIARQVLSESLAIALAGGAAGIALAFGGVRLAVRLAPATLPRIAGARVNANVLLVAVALSLVSSLLFGLVPAWQALRNDPRDGLKAASGRGIAAGGAGRVRDVLVACEIALSFTLALAAGLLVRGMMEMDATPLGFRTERILVAYAHSPANTMLKMRVATRFFEQALQELGRLPGVVSTGAAMGLPTGRYNSNGKYAVTGQEFRRETVEGLPDAGFRLASQGYFATLGIPLVAGRDFSERDQYDAPLVVIVSASLARRSFPGESPLGKTILTGFDGSGPMTIVGVVGDVRSGGPAQAPGPELYMPFQQHPPFANELQLVVRTAGDPARMALTVARKMRALDPEIAIQTTTLESMVASSVDIPRFRTWLVGAFAAVALLLAMAGVYGVMAYVVNRRTGELGLRMALGCAPGGVVRLVLVRAMALAAAGLGAGVALSAAAARVLATLLPGVRPTDAWGYASAALAIALVTLVAAIAPAWRAARIDPAVALRGE